MFLESGRSLIRGTHSNPNTQKRELYRYKPNILLAERMEI